MKYTIANKNQTQWTGTTVECNRGKNQWTWRSVWTTHRKKSEKNPPEIQGV